VCLTSARPTIAQGGRCSPPRRRLYIHPYPTASRPPRFPPNPIRRDRFYDPLPSGCCSYRTTCDPIPLWTFRSTSSSLRSLPVTYVPPDRSAVFPAIEAAARFVRGARFLYPGDQPCRTEDVSHPGRSPFSVTPVPFFFSCKSPFSLAEGPGSRCFLFSELSPRSTKPLDAIQSICPFPPHSSSRPALHPHLGAFRRALLGRPRDLSLSLFPSSENISSRVPVISIFYFHHFFFSERIFSISALTRDEHVFGPAFPSPSIPSCSLCPPSSFYSASTAFYVQSSLTSWPCFPAVHEGVLRKAVYSRAAVHALTRT